MGARGEEVLVGALCAVLAVVMARRIWVGIWADEMPLYRTRLRKVDIGDIKFELLVAFNAALFVVLLVISADLLLGLNLRGR